MNDKPSPTKWPSAFLGGCMSILFGCIALYVAVKLIERVAVALVIGSMVARGMARGVVATPPARRVVGASKRLWRSRLRTTSGAGYPVSVVKFDEIFDVMHSRIVY